VEEEVDRDVEKAAEGGVALLEEFPLHGSEHHSAVEDKSQAHFTFREKMTVKEKSRGVLSAQVGVVERPGVC